MTGGWIVGGGGVAGDDDSDSGGDGDHFVFRETDEYCSPHQWGHQWPRPNFPEQPRPALCADTRE